MHKIAGTAAAGLLALGALACGPTQEEVAELRSQQTEILEKLAKLEEGQKKILAGRPAAAAPKRAPEDYDRVYEIPIGSAPIKGNPDAPITIVEWSDFQCPFCASAAPLVNDVQEKYGKDRVRVVYKHFPLNFHPAARPAAVASIAAQKQGKFWEMHDVLFKHTRSLSGDKMNDYASEAGLDVEQFKKDFAEHWLDFW